MTRGLRLSGVGYILRLCAVGLAVVGVTACLDDSVTGVRPLTMELTVEPTTASAGETIDVTYSATGTGLAIVLVEYGDGVADTALFSGPIEVGGDLTHSYASAGSFVIVGSAVGVDGTARDSVTVTIN